MLNPPGPGNSSFLSSCSLVWLGCRQSFNKAVHFKYPTSNTWESQLDAEYLQREALHPAQSRGTVQLPSPPHTAFWSTAA